MLEKDFLKYCEEALNNLFKKIEEEDKNSKLDIEYSDGILKILIDKSKQTFVINRHTASQKIWYSSPFSGVAYFSFNQTNNQWLDDKNKELISTTLNELNNHF
ncbi:MAG: iron donor protein CyaY [Rickettsiales bacterium]|nr:iron donor protein CyaY [Rickettsiales bacterium]